MSSILDFLNTPSNDNNNLKAFKEDYSDFSSIDKSNDPIGVIKSEEEKEVTSIEPSEDITNIDIDSENENIEEEKLNEIEKRILDNINNNFASGEGLDLTFSKKNIVQLQKELQGLFDLRKKTNIFNKATEKLESMIRGLAAKIESTKFVSQKRNKFKWKRNTPYLVFHKGKTFGGVVISLATFSPFSHCDIVINGKSYTAYPEGVGEYDIPPESEIVIYELSDDYDYKKILKFYEETKGTRYGFTDAIRGFFNITDVDKEADKLKSFFCSQWVIAAMDIGSGKKKKWHGKPIRSQGYNWFSPINLFDYMINSDDVVKSKESLTVQNNVTLYRKYKLAAGESFLMYETMMKAFGEADEEDIPSGELGEDGPVEDTSDDTSEDTGQEEDSGGFDDNFSDDGFGDDSDTGEDGDQSKIKDPLADIEDSQKELVGDLRKNMSSFYKARENDLEKILSSNIGTSEYGKEVNELIENYKTTLSLYETYLRNEYYKESTTNKIMSFVKYKSIFNRLNENLNKFFELLGVED